MNYYLITIACSMDDVPVRIFTDPKEATRFAKAMDVDAELQAVIKKSNFASSEPLFVRISRFSAKTGRMLSSREVRDMEDEIEVS